MHQRTFVAVLVGGAALLGGGWLAYDARFRQPSAADKVDSEDHGHHGDRERVRISPQAQANLNLDVRSVRPQTYWRTIRVPGVVVESGGQSDHGITAPIAGVVKQVFAVPGDTVRPGAGLFVLSLTSEYLQSSQTELNKTARELAITREQKERLGKIAEAIAGARLIELQNQLDRLGALRKAQRNDLALRGLTASQIDAVEQGEFVREITIRVPPSRQSRATVPSVSAETGGQAPPEPLYELEALKVRLGEQAQAGQVLALLGDHQHLYIEGRGFREDTALVERSAARGWPVSATFAEDVDADWPPLQQELTIQYLANALDPTSQTFPFYIPLDNQARNYTRTGKTYRLWRFRPGQRLHLGVRVQEFNDVFVLPQGAVVREGPEAYVFRQNGDFFERKPVHVVYEDSSHVVLSGGSVLPGSYLAQHGAAALNRAMQARGGAAEHGHDHHGHSHEH
jgi:multidrug efflux pump subunit AcrA (membrane-fusion protein)